MCSDRIYPFAYFLKDKKMLIVADDYHKRSPYRFIFVGRLISGKRIDLLINALSELTQYPFEFLYRWVRY